MSNEERLYSALKVLQARLPPAESDLVVGALAGVAERAVAEVQARSAAERLSAVERFSERPDRRETAIAFFQRCYAELVADGEIFADDLRRHDVRLYDALSVHQSSRGARLSDLLPVRLAPLRRGRPSRRGASDRAA